MTPDALAEIHSAAFRTTRAWSSQEFAALLDSPLCFLVSTRESFALGRLIGPEVELLTLAVRPESQGQGFGRSILKQFEARASEQGAEKLLLEVSAENNPAIKLYLSNGYIETARRKAYYKDTKGSFSDAIVMTKSTNA